MSPINQLLAVSSPLGDPRDSSTWGGGPRILIEKLEELGLRVIGISTRLTASEAFLYRAFHFARGLGYDYRRGQSARLRAASMLRRKMEAVGIKKVLHMSTLDLPMPGVSGIHHYLACDSTWHLYTRWHTGMHRYPQKMTEMADRLERKSYTQVDHFFPFFHFVRDDLINHYGIRAGKVTAVHAGRLQIRPYYGEKNYGAGNILFVARSHFGDKGGPLILEAFKIAQARNPSLTLTMAGNDRYVKLAGAMPNLIVRGAVSEDELQSLYESASLVAVPAMNLTGSVYLEALACRTPVLGLNRHALQEITCDGKYGFLVDEPCPKAIAETILKAFSDPDRLSQMGTSGQSYALKEFSYDLAAKKIAEVIAGDRVVRQTKTL